MINWYNKPIDAYPNPKDYEKLTFIECGGFNNMNKLEEEYSWQYPVTYSRKKGETIHHRAKFHLFKKNYKSACEKYIQWREHEYDTEYVLSLGENNICKKCLEKYKELKDND